MLFSNNKRVRTIKIRQSRGFKQAAETYCQNLLTFSKNILFPISKFLQETLFKVKQREKKEKNWEIWHKQALRIYDIEIIILYPFDLTSQ